ncbi:hypothetical protein D3C86_1357160 [compost metagenome]
MLPTEFEDAGLKPSGCHLLDIPTANFHAVFSPGNIRVQQYVGLAPITVIAIAVDQRRTGQLSTLGETSTLA